MGTASVHRRPAAASARTAAGLVLAGALLSACTSPAGPLPAPGADPTSGSPSTALATAPPAQPPATLTRAGVDTADGKLDQVVQRAMDATGVPGLAVAVVYQDEVVYSKGYGVREVGKPDTVGPDTVFQLASLSKPLASTVVAGAVDGKTVSWSDPVQQHDPGFTLQDPWVSSHLTLADLFAHRSGLPEHAGDLLEDLGYDRDYVLGHLRLEPLSPFRVTYDYTNFGLTEAAVAVARTKGISWEQLSADTLYRPLGMHSTSSTFADYQKAADKAVTHVRADGGWQAKYTRNADAQSPAGGASSSVQDMARWMRLQLGGGKFDGRQVIGAAALQETHLPEIVISPPQAPGGRAGFYGLGWNVGYDEQARLRLNHSGAFALGAATTVTLLPSEGLGIVVLTNGEPLGVPEAVAASYLDIAQHGRETVDWLGAYGGIIGRMMQAGHSATDYTRPPADAAPARPDGAYLGSYANDYYGPLTVTAQGGGLVMTLGPAPGKQFPLQHFDGDTFSYPTVGENAVGLSGVTFTVEAGGTANKVVVENLDHEHLGTFTRA
ncbi:serine hydrolase [Kitasatospora sp. NPDC057223]|uniref:serine hydrolase n=1 Tax=Kitasatospora sp. NPDC057223 TaxID=3346055 RepID=UPI003630274B